MGQSGIFVENIDYSKWVKILGENVVLEWLTGILGENIALSKVGFSEYCLGILEGILVVEGVMCTHTLIL